MDGESTLESVLEYHAKMFNMDTRRKCLEFDVYLSNFGYLSNSQDYPFDEAGLAKRFKRVEGSRAVTVANFLKWINKRAATLRASGYGEVATVDTKVAPFLKIELYGEGHNEVIVTTEKGVAHLVTRGEPAVLHNTIPGFGVQEQGWLLSVVEPFLREGAFKNPKHDIDLIDDAMRAEYLDRRDRRRDI